MSVVRNARRTKPMRVLDNIPNVATDSRSFLLLLTLFTDHSPLLTNHYLQTDAHNFGRALIPRPCAEGLSQRSDRRTVGVAGVAPGSEPRGQVGSVVGIGQE